MIIVFLIFMKYRIIVAIGQKTKQNKRYLGNAFFNTEYELIKQ
ncbi:hypothetical protein [Aestuariibaculum sediminum]|nr:hypothetical protein [Aestuariibaculum sediminum]